MGRSNIIIPALFRMQQQFITSTIFIPKHKMIKINRVNLLLFLIISCIHLTAMKKTIKFESFSPRNPKLQITSAQKAALQDERNEIIRQRMIQEQRSIAEYNQELLEEHGPRYQLDRRLRIRRHVLGKLEEERKLQQDQQSKPSQKPELQISPQRKPQSNCTKIITNACIACTLITTITYIAYQLNDSDLEI